MDFISIVYTIYNEKDIEDTFVHEKLIKLCLMAEQAGGVHIWQHRAGYQYGCRLRQMQVWQQLARLEWSLQGWRRIARRKKVQYIEIEPTTKTWLRNFIKTTKQLGKNNLKLPLALFSEVCYYKSRQRRQMNRKDSFGAFFVSTMGTEGTGTSVPMGE